MSGITQRVVDYAAQECKWQLCDPLAVSWMIAGWRYAHRYRNRAVMVGDILKLSNLVEPRSNSGFSFRRHDVEVNGARKMSVNQIDDAIERIVWYQPEIGSDDEQVYAQWFKAYEDIHPLGDGNGRTGSLLYNWLRGSLHEPVHPPNLWGDPRRSYDGYPTPQVR